MSRSTIPYNETGYFSQLMCDYLAEKPELKDFYGRFPKLQNFKAQLKDKKVSVRSQSRTTLREQLQHQYKVFTVSEETQKKHYLPIRRKHLYHYNRAPVKSFYRTLMTERRKLVGNAGYLLLLQIINYLSP